jgi:very-short-patch-repair endonuclease
MAAVLACAPGAVLSHHAAASFWGLRQAPGGPIDVLVTGRKQRSRPGIRVRSAISLDARDIHHRGRLLVTSPPRTLLDLAGVLSPRDLRRAVDEASARRLAGRADLVAALERSPRARGATVLRSLLAADREPALTRSEAEERMLELIRAGRLPTPRVNARVGAYEVDLLWPPQRLVLEVDGYAFHSSRRAFETDRLRDAHLQAAGFRVLRVTWRQITDEPEAVLVTLARMLA